ncbi:MAG: metabolite traffic protein EboE, partial [Verrucomicrobia bacterium]|nr:metabolite traffic protein EboE [Verrucomicrobiota bacterium]
TINGFPYGRFHGASVKENVYRPDWTASDRLAYTCLLFDLLAALLPAGVEGSVSTLAGSFKEFDPDAAARKRIFDNLWRCARHAARAGGRFGRALRLGLEPEPLCLMENADETVRFFDELRAHCKNDPRVEECIGVNYDTCHFAIAFEEPRAALSRLVDAGIKISKIQLSSALKARPTIAARQKLKEFADEIYLHQVAVRDETGRRAVHRDLPDALAGAAAGAGSSEWRIHFHVPLHAPAVAPLETTADDLLRTLDWLAGNPRICSHLEMETYTWDVLPPELKARTVVSQLLAEYRWTLHHLAKRGLGAHESD